MTRKRTAASGFFDMPAAIAKAAIDQLTPEQREKITPAQATNIMNVAVATARDIAEIIEPRAEVPMGLIARNAGEKGENDRG